MQRRMNSTLRVSLFSLALLGAACEDDDGSAKPDASTEPDAATDGSAEPDAATEPDAGEMPDAMADADDPSETDAGEMPDADAGPGTIVDVAVATDDLSTLVAAVQAAGLAETLAGPGPYTVLAPTNAAFEALPEGALDALLADTDALTEVLLHHVIDGEVAAADLAGVTSVETLAGQTLQVDTSDGVRFDDASVVTADVEASNGVVHVIDTVLLPTEEEAPGTIVDVAVATDDLSTLVAAVQAAGLAETLAGPGPYTVLAPTNAAFEALPEGALDALLADTDALTEVLLHHVIEGEVPAADLAGVTSVETLAGQTLQVDTSDGVRFDDASVVTADVDASNGVVHVIDGVLLPE